MRIGLIFTLVVLLSACGAQGACTASFETLSVKIIDDSGAPIVDAVVRTVLSDGNILETDSTFGNPEGDYILADDDALDILKDRETAVSFEVKRGDVERSVPYVIFANRCHVENYEGPKVIMLE